MEKNRKYSVRTSIVILVILIGAVALRLYKLNKYDLWFDELISDNYTFINISRAADWYGITPLSFFLKNALKDQHSILYYAFVYIYSFLFGGGQSLRIISVIFSMFSLWLLFLIAKLFFSQRVSVYALLLMALNPLCIWYAQEARGYAMAVFFVLLMLYCFMRAMRTNRVLYWICFSIAGSFAFYLSYYSIFLLFNLCVFLFFKKGYSGIRKSLLSLCVMLLFFLFLLPVIIPQIHTVKSSFWLPEPSLKSIASTFQAFTLGYSAALKQHLAGLVVFLSLFMYGVYSYYKSNRLNTMFLLLSILVPVGAAYVFSKLVTPIYLDRQFLIFAPFYFLFVAKGIGSIKNNRVQVLVSVLVVSLLSTSLINYYSGQICPVSTGVWEKKNYNKLITHIKREFKAGDRLVVTDPQSWVIINHSIISAQTCSLGPVYLLFYPHTLADFEKEWFEMNAFPQRFNKDNNSFPYMYYMSKQNKARMIEKLYLDDNAFKRIWVVSSTWEVKGDLCVNSLAVRKYLVNNNYKKTGFKQQDGMYVEFFTKM